MSNIQSKLLSHVKMQENTIQNENKHQSIGMDLEMAQMLELFDKD